LELGERFGSKAAVKDNEAPKQLGLVLELVTERRYA
jgi:hypothetical protein